MIDPSDSIRTFAHRMELEKSAGGRPVESAALGSVLLGFGSMRAHSSIFELVRAPAPPVRVPVTRIEKLAADLASTGVFAQKDGTREPSSPVPDGGGADLVVRDTAGAVHAYSWATGATAPAAVERALQVGGAFASEVERQHPRTPCACRPGDPLCACL
ncbi:MAG: hypothetical protein JWO86_2251 [Myxococcaceae bacterium]|jgi:hypothetical protein|nr:hypothetical protein [Myxococcaceae bacterium]